LRRAAVDYDARPMKPIDKRALIHALHAELRREIGVLSSAAKDAREYAAHEEAKPENDKDTRGLEAAYLAGAQAERVRELEKVVNALEFLVLRDFKDGDAIALSAIVELDLDGALSHYFFAPVGGGMRATIDGVDVQVVTPQSPMGQALVGKTVGDVVELRVKQGRREYEVVGVI
jgi:transcription elongation GreA/GreB family factor